MYLNFLVHGIDLMESMRYFKESFQLFVPKKDKELVRSLKDFQSLDELIAYYEDIFVMYDSIIGLDGSTFENKKVKIVIS